MHIRSLAAKAAKILAVPAAASLLALGAPAARAATPVPGPQHTSSTLAVTFNGTYRMCSETDHGPYCLNLPYNNCTAGQLIGGHSLGSYTTENVDFWTGSNGRHMLTLHNCGGALCIAHDTSNRLVLSAGCSYSLDSDTFSNWYPVNNAYAWQNYGTNLYIAIWDAQDAVATLHALDPLSGSTDIIYYSHV